LTYDVLYNDALYVSRQGATGASDPMTLLCKAIAEAQAHYQAGTKCDPGEASS
jgi:hypothetical protein